MRGAVAADQTGAVHGQHHRQILQRNIVDQLIVGPLQKGRVDRHHGPEPIAGNARRDRHRVLLGDRHIEVALREASGIFHQPGALPHRGSDPHHTLSAPASSISHCPKTCE